MNLRLISLALIPLLAAAHFPQDDAAKKDLQAMQGNWKMAAYVVEGQTTPPAELAKIHLNVKGNVSTFRIDKQASHGTYVLHAAKSPKTLDIDLTDGPDKGKKKLAIYAFEKNQLRICVAAVGGPRPAEFKAGKGVNLETWQRAKAVAIAPAAGDDKKGMAAKPAAPPAPVPSPFKDKNLEAAVRGALHQPTGDLTDTNLLNVYILEAADKKITNLVGLEKCKNLALLKASKNQISDVRPLRELTNLQSLDLSDNNISDIAPLAGLTKLQYLELSHNQVAKIDALAGMAAMNSLYLGGNQIADLTPIAKLSKLWTLNIPKNRIANISPIAGLTRLSTIDLSDNAITDLGPLSKFKEVNLLMLERNKISDLTPLIDLLKLDAQGDKRIGPFLNLYLGGNPLSDTAKGSQTQALKSFGARIKS
jgi:internalin A